MSDFFAALGKTIAEHYYTQTHEVEVRTTVDKALFDSMYVKATSVFGDDAAILKQVTYEDTVSMKRDDLRYTYNAFTGKLKSIDAKTTLSKCDFYAGNRRLRVAVSLEETIRTPATEQQQQQQPDENDENWHRRERERISFTLPWAPNWRLDFTRARDGQQLQHEVEFELLRAKPTQPDVQDPLAQFRRLATFVGLI
jgi:hypothetical protein